jgi:iron only hydrogenase large subunit-like protein
MDRLVAGNAPYHFIEIMACPGGCVAGGGQPLPVNNDVRRLRAQALYREDKNLTIRKSHENPSILRIYQEFLQKPLGEKSHHLLHTTYTVRGKYGEGQAASLDRE